MREEFRLPLCVFALLALGFVPGWYYLWIAAILVGIGKIVWNSVEKLREGTYSLDYIAFLAMVVALPSGEFLAGAVVSLMITGGEALDEYASRRAESALRSLLERIPKVCIVRESDGTTHEVPIQEVRGGQVIVVRPNELLPLDGTLVSEAAELNEANLTGEALPVSFARGAFLKSGSVNAGATIELTVEGSFETSTYMKIVHLVDEAKRHQPRVVRLAEQVNFPFTAVTLILGGVAWAYTGELSRALAVLVIATPCPLLIAAPVAFIGGLSRAARKNIIVKRPATLEDIAHVETVFFDKTGTLTLGEPRLVRVEATGGASEEEPLSIAAAIEFHSIHPLARAVCSARADRNAPLLESRAVVETIGKGIEGEVAGTRYRIAKASKATGSGIALGVYQGEREIGLLQFEDVIKENVGRSSARSRSTASPIEMLTGDRRENAGRLFAHSASLYVPSFRPNLNLRRYRRRKRAAATAMMVGDGLNDAPALAQADVGVVFSGTENSAAIDAADAVILSRDVTLVNFLLENARRSMRIASKVFGSVSDFPP